MTPHESGMVPATGAVFAGTGSDLPTRGVPVPAHCVCLLRFLGELRM